MPYRACRVTSVKKDTREEYMGADIYDTYDVLVISARVPGEDVRPCAPQFYALVAPFAVAFVVAARLALEWLVAGRRWTDRVMFRVLPIFILFFFLMSIFLRNHTRGTISYMIIPKSHSPHTIKQIIIHQLDFECAFFFEMFFGKLKCVSGNCT